jgi:hypothetical protein
MLHRNPVRITQTKNRINLAYVEHIKSCIEENHRVAAHPLDKIKRLLDWLSPEFIKNNRPVFYCILKKHREPMQPTGLGVKVQVRGVLHVNSISHNATPQYRY